MGLGLDPRGTGIRSLPLATDKITQLCFLGKANDGKATIGIFESSFSMRYLIFDGTLSIPV